MVNDHNIGFGLINKLKYENTNKRINILKGVN